MLYAIIGLLAVIADQAVKYWTPTQVWTQSTGKVLIPGVLSLVNVHNDGAAFSILAGSNARIPFIIITGVFLLLVILALATNFISGRFARWCLVFVAAGGFSNCIDRVIYGYVQDMFKCELFNFPVFNVADIFITVFCVLFIIAVLFERTNVDDDEYFEDDEEEDDEEEESEEDLRAARRAAKAEKREARRAAKAAKAAAREEEEEDEEPAPVRPVRKSRRERAEEAYSQAQQKSDASAEPAAEAPVVKKPVAPARRPVVEAPVPEAEPEMTIDDPFAAWEAANARVNSAASPAANRPAARTPVQTPQRASAPAAQPRPAAPRPVASKPVTAAPAAPAKPAAAPRPAAQPKATPAKKAPAAEEFSLDDILAEFK